MADSQLLPMVLTRDLPFSTAELTAGDTVILVKANKETVRVPVESFTGDYVTRVGSVPESPNDAGQEGDIAWDEDAIYTYVNGVWGKTPRTTTNWGDYTAHSRFLLVSGPQNLSAAEQETAQQNLGIDSASTTNKGMVQLAASMDENEGNVPTTTLVKEYVAAEINRVIQQYQGDHIANYKGEVRIVGPDDEQILYYDSVGRVLYVGSGVNIIYTKPSNKFSVLNSSNNEQAVIEPNS